MRSSTMPSSAKPPMPSSTKPQMPGSAKLQMASSRELQEPSSTLPTSKELPASWVCTSHGVWRHGGAKKPSKRTIARAAQR